MHDILLLALFFFLTAQSKLVSNLTPDACSGPSSSLTIEDLVLTQRDDPPNSFRMFVAGHMPDGVHVEAVNTARIAFLSEHGPDALRVTDSKNATESGYDYFPPKECKALYEHFVSEYAAQLAARALLPHRQLPPSMNFAISRVFQKAQRVQIQDFLLNKLLRPQANGQKGQQSRETRQCDWTSSGPGAHQWAKSDPSQARLSPWQRWWSG